MVCANRDRDMSEQVVQYTMEDQFFLAQAKSQIGGMGPQQFKELQDLSLRLLEGFVLQRAATRGMMTQALSATLGSHKEFLEKQRAASEPG